jgi:Mg2+-importing ATPase
MIAGGGSGAARTRRAAAPVDHRAFATLPADALLGRLGTSPHGLAGAEADRRLADVGPNDPAPPGRGVVLDELLGFLTNPLVLILLLASLVSAALGDVPNAEIIAVIVVLSVALNFAQAFRSRRAAERLRLEVAPTASVRRDGRWQELPRRALVPGDVIRLSAGDRVPADARLLKTRDLHIQQAALTGESIPVEKEAADQPPDPGSIAEARNLVFLGTSVVSGTGTAVVIATGPATAFGDIAARLSTRPPETEFERGLKWFALLVTRTVLFLVLFVVLVNLVLRRPALESLLFAVALAVGLTPEFLPMITTVTLAKGALRMARRRIVVKHLAAIEDFGSLDVLCSDKTGTLTTGEMVLEGCLDPLGTPAERPFLFAYLNSVHETGIRSPLDAAILRAGQPDVGAYRKLDEIPFDFERRRLSVVVEAAGERWLITKGAPERVLAACDAFEAGGRTCPLDEATRARCRATFETLSEQGLRVLAVAARRLPPQARYTTADEEALGLVGFLTFADPVMPGVADALRALRRDGVALKVLTGDNERVARHVCAQVGLDSGRIVLGDELDTMTESALAAVAEQATVFARVSPRQKHRVILALKSRDHVVGFLGDGINDAPSLHAADVGISVVNAVDVAKDAADIILGERTLHVLHDGIVEGRKAFANVMKYLFMGTSSNFGNMVSMAGAVAFLPFLPMLPTQILLNNFLYDLAQVTIPTDRVDPAFVRVPQRWDIRTIRTFMLVIGPVSSLYDGLTFWVLLALFQASEAFFHTGWFVESLATQTLVLFVIRTTGHPLSSRPSAPLTLTTLAVVLVGIALPYSPVGPRLGFVPLPPAYFGFLAVATVTYLALVEVVKQRLLRPSRGKAAGLDPVP